MLPEPTAPQEIPSYPFEITELETNFSALALGDLRYFTHFPDYEVTSPAYWYYYKNTWYPFAFAYNQWHGISTEELRTGEYITVQKVPSNAKVPSRERIAELIEHNLLREEPSRPQTPRIQLADIAASTSHLRQISRKPSTPRSSAPHTPSIQPITLAPPTPTNPTIMSAVHATTTSATTTTTNGSMLGTPPTIFTGDRSKSEDFVNEFKRYVRLNRNHAVMRLPYDRVMMALSYMKGPLFNDWVKAQENATDNKVNRTTNPIPETDEIL